MIQIQERDFKVLRLCYEQRFLTRDHFASFFGHRSRYYRRLKMMEEAEWIRREPTSITGSRFIIRLTALGERLAEDHYGIKFSPLKAPNLNIMNHDALVTSVRLRLAQIWDATFVPERALQMNETGELPDGIFFFPSGKGIAIEVECSDKGKTQFLQKVKRWEGSTSITFVLYVCPHPGLYKALVRYISLAPNVPLGIVHWDELRKGAPLVHTRNDKLNLFTIDNLATLNR